MSIVPKTASQETEAIVRCIISEIPVIKTSLSKHPDTTVWIHGRHWIAYKVGTSFYIDYTALNAVRALRSTNV